MSQLNLIETQSNLDAIPLSGQTKFRLNEINKIKNSFNSEIQERKTMSKKLSKYNAAFHYIEKSLIVLSATSGGISIISFESVIRIPAGIASASFTLIFSLRWYQGKSKFFLKKIIISLHNPSIQVFYRKTFTKN